MKTYADLIIHNIGQLITPKPSPTPLRKNPIEKKIFR